MTNTPESTPALPAVVADLSGAPLPTTQTLRQRRSLPFQALRFLTFNTRIMRMVLKGH